MINKKRVLAEFFELVKIKCSTRDERQVADILKTRLADLGMEVTEDNVGEKIGGTCGNVIAYAKGTVADAPALMLTAHMDCVEPCGGIEPQLKDGIITSVGETILGGDDKAGIVAILEALRMVGEKEIPHGPIQVIFTVAEEGGLNGAKNIDPAALKADFGYAFDSGGAPGEIINMAPGQNSINVVVHGKKAHAGVAPEDGINAIVVAGKAMAELLGAGTVAGGKSKRPTRSSRAPAAAAAGQRTAARRKSKRTAKRAGRSARAVARPAAARRKAPKRRGRR